MLSALRISRSAAAATVLSAHLLAATLVVAQPDGGGPPPALVRVAEVRQEELVDRWDAIGRLREVRRSIVAAERSGRVVEIGVEEGDAVVAGKTLLVRTDDIWTRLALREAEAALAKARAEVEQAKARLEQSRTDLKYLEELQRANSARPREVDNARATVLENEAQVAAARAAVASADAALARVNEELKRLQILAPFDGILVSKMTEVGQWANSGEGIGEIISSKQIDAVIDVPEHLINLIQVGDTLEVVIEPLGREVEGKVAAIVPFGSVTARTFPVKVRLDDEGGALKSGMSALAHVPTGRRKTLLTVPRDAIVRQPTGTVVWANLNGAAVPIGVRVLFGVEGRYAVEMKDGGPPLAPGMQVVVEGAERLFPTRPLMIAPDHDTRASAQPQS